MTELDLGPLVRIRDKAAGFKFEPSVDLGATEQAFAIGDLTGTQVRVHEILGKEKFVRASLLDASRSLGLAPEDFNPDDRAIYDEYLSARVSAATDQVVASKIADTVWQQDVANLPARFGTSVAQPLVDLTYQVGSLLSKGATAVLGTPEEAIPRALNWVFGLGSDQAATPNLRAYTGAALRNIPEAINASMDEIGRRKLAEALQSPDPALRQRAQAQLNKLNQTPPATDKTFADRYREQVQANEIRDKGLSTTQRVGEGVVDVVGTVQGLMSGPVGKALGAVEAKVGMKAMHESLLAGAASKPFIGKWAQRYLGQLIGPTWRYSLSEFSRTNALGDRPHLGDQALDGLVTFVTMPIFAGASWAAEKLQRGISGEASALTAAFKKYTGMVSSDVKGKWMSSGTFDQAAAYKDFVDAGMPYLRKDVARRVAGVGVQGMIEGMAFSPTDRAFWHDLTNALWGDDPQESKEASSRVLEAMLTNALAWGVMGAGGLRNHVDRETVRKLGESYGIDPFATPEPPKTVGEEAAEIVRNENLEIQEADPQLRTWKLLEAKQALDGIGETVTDGVKLVYDGENSPRLVRFRDGIYESRPLYEGDWVESPEYAAERLGPVQPTIPEQADITGKVAARLLYDPTTGLTPMQESIVAKAAEVAARVRAEDNPGVKAALEVAAMMDPQQWGPKQFAAWVKMILQGDTPNALAALADAFVNPNAAIAQGYRGLQPAPGQKIRPEDRGRVGSRNSEVELAGAERVPETGYEGVEVGKPGPRPTGSGDVNLAGERAAPVTGYEGTEVGHPGPRPTGEGGVDLAGQARKPATGYEGTETSERGPKPRGDGGVDLGEAKQAAAQSGYEGALLETKGRVPKGKEGVGVDLAGDQRKIDSGYEGALGGDARRPSGSGVEIDLATGAIKQPKTPKIDAEKSGPARPDLPGGGDWLDRRPEGVLRQIAQAMSLPLPEGATRDDVVNALRKAGVDDPESGQASPVALAAVAGVGVLGAAILTGAVASIGSIAAVGALAASPWLVKWSGNQFYRLMEHHGPIDKARMIGAGMLKTAQETVRSAGNFARTANTIRWLTNHQPVDMRKSGRLERLALTAAVLGGGYMGHDLFGSFGGTGLGVLAGGVLGAGSALGITAARGGQHKTNEQKKAAKSLESQELTDIASIPGAQFGVAKVRLFADAWTKSLAGLSKSERIVVNLLKKLGAQVAQEASEAGMLFRSRDGSLLDPKILAGIRRIPTFFTQTYYKMMQEKGSPLARAWVAALAQLNNMTVEEVDREIEWHQPGAPKISTDHRTIGIETARRFRYLPSSIYLNGIEQRMLEDRPFEIAMRALTTTAARIAYHRVFGNELTEEELQLHPRTPEQQMLRDAMAKYVDEAVNPVKANELLTRVQRAANQLPAFDRMTSPGSAADQVYHGILRPARSLWAAAKLSAAFILNIPEPLGTPAAYTSYPTIARELGATWWMAATNPAEFRKELGRMQTKGWVGDQVPDFLAVERQAGKLANAGERVSHAMKFFIAPMQFVNTINAVAVARAGEALVAEWKANPVKAGEDSFLRGGQEAWIEKLRQAGVEDRALAVRMLDGQATDREYDAWIGNLRRFSMGERLPVEQAYTQLMPLLKETTPFQSYGANNQRVVMDAMQALTDSLPTKENKAKFTKQERAAKARLFFELASKKGLAHGVGLMAMMYWAYGAAATEAFVGEDGEFDWDGAIQRYAKFVFNAEASGYAVSTAARSLTESGGDTGFMDAIKDYARTVPMIDILVTLDEAARTEGKFLNRAAATGVTGLAQKILGMFEDMTPLARHVRTWAEDPELALAIRRYYEILPITGKGREVEYSQWSSAMRRFRTKLRARILHPETWNSEDMWDLLEEAAVTGREGWDSVSAGLKSRRLLHNLDATEAAKLTENLSPQLLKRLVEHDRALDYFALRAKMRE